MQNTHSAGAGTKQQAAEPAEPQYFRPGSLVLIYLILTFGAAVPLLAYMAPPFSAERQLYFFYVPTAWTCVGVYFLLLYRPAIIRLSRRKPEWRDVTGVLAGIGTALLAISLDDAPFAASLVPPRNSVHFVVPVVLVAPVAEELLFRGIFLRSLVETMPRSIAVLVVVVLAAYGHSDFYVALPMQLAVSLLYLRLGCSLPAAIALHLAHNLWVTFPYFLD